MNQFKLKSDIHWIFNFIVLTINLIKNNKSNIWSILFNTFKGIAVSIWIVLIISVVTKIAFIQNKYNFEFNIAMLYTYHDLFKPICSWLISIAIFGFAVFSLATDYKLQNNIFQCQNKFIVVVLTLLLSLINNFISAVIIPNDIGLKILIIIYLVSTSTFIYLLKYIKSLFN